MQRTPKEKKCIHSLIYIKLKELYNRFSRKNVSSHHVKVRVEKVIQSASTHSKLYQKFKR